MLTPSRAPAAAAKPTVQLRESAAAFARQPPAHHPQLGPLCGQTRAAKHGGNRARLLPVLLAMMMGLAAQSGQAQTESEADADANAAAPEASPPPLPLQSPGAALHDPALTAEAFDALTLGRTFDTHDANAGLYGIESFYPNRQVVWQDAEGCALGHWYSDGPQICFEYQGGSNNPICWSYHDRNGWIMGWFHGDRQNVPIMLYPKAGPPVSCGEFLGS